MPPSFHKAIWLVLGLYLLSPSLLNAVEPSVPSQVEVLLPEKSSKAERKELKRKRKAFKKAINANDSGVFKNTKFRYGLLAFLVGLGLSLLVILLNLPAFVGYLGVVGITTGMVLLIWGILETFTL